MPWKKSTLLTKDHCQQMALDNVVTIFRDSWNVYQKLIAENYMMHREFGEALSAVLQQFRNAPSLDILDLGCGDARLMAGQLQSFDHFNYKGFDLSETALSYAKQNTSLLKGKIYLVNGPMEELIDYETTLFDIIHSSFAIHHLSEEKKQALIMSCAEKLKEDGVLVIADVFRKDNQSRENYLEEYLHLVYNKWTALNETDREIIVNHITNYDFPSVLSEFEGYLNHNGFKVQPKVDIDPWHKMLVIRKSF
jgi:SAM-dependent methyltransferase